MWGVVGCHQYSGAPMMRAWVSFSIGFGVVPDAIGAWNPESAPQAIVMNRRGNKDPAKAGPWLPGMAAWLRGQADEEIVHANKFIDHFADRDIIRCSARSHRCVPS